MLNRVNRIKIGDVIKIYLSVVVFLSLSAILSPTLEKSLDYRKSPTNFLNDIQAYTIATQIIRDGKIHELYNLQTQKEYQNTVMPGRNLTGMFSFRAMPMTAYLYLPLSYIDPVNMFYVVTAMNFALLLGIVYLIYRIFNINKNLVFIVFSLLPLFSPLWSVVRNGQPSLLLIFLVLTAYHLVRTNKLVNAGATMSLLFLKVNYLPIAVLTYLLIHWGNRQKAMQYLKGLIIGSLVIIVINMFLYGPNLLWEYPQFLFKTENSSYGTSIIRNLNPTSIVYLLTQNNQATFWGGAIVSVVGYCVFLLLFKKMVDGGKAWLAFAFVPAITMLFNIHTMQSDAVAFIILSFVIPNYFLSFDGRKRWFLALLVVFAVFIGTSVRSFSVQSVAFMYYVFLGFVFCATV
jgi:hypothetical protein